MNNLNSRNLEFLRSINDIDDDLIASASLTPAKKIQSTKRIYKKWAVSIATAAIICLTAGMSFFFAQKFKNQNVTRDNTIVSFAINGTYYEKATLQSYMEYGLVDNDVTPRSTISIPPLSKEDLGELMGTLKISDREYPVYHYAKYPETDSICIIELSNGELSIFVKQE